MNRDRLIQKLFDVIDDLNTQLPEERCLQKTTSTVLFGRSGNLDSVELVRLIIGMEEKIEAEFGIAISLADERAMSQERSPFETVGSMVDYMAALMDEHAHE